MLRMLNILLVEDNPQDAELVLRELRRAGFEPSWSRVETEAHYLEKLHAGLDIILSDFEMPQFNGLKALQLLEKSGLDIPFIVISGTIGEERAVEAMKLGATDYLMKDRLARLGSAVSRALELHRVHAERKHAEQALRESEDRFRQLAENINEVFWMTDPTKKEVLYVSPAFETIWGESRENLYKSPKLWLEKIHPEDQALVIGASAKMATGEYNETYRIVHPDGTVRWIRDKAYPVHDASGQVYRIVGIAEDISDQKLMEEKFLRAQRMESIGSLASGVAHDLNNILAPMLMAAGLLKERLTDEQDRDMLTLVETSAHRGARIIAQLLTFSRGVEGARISVQLRHLFKEMDHLMRETFPRNIEISSDLPSDLRPVLADATQMHQLFLNLCVNARDAMLGGGRLSLSAENFVLDEKQARQHPQAKPGRYVLVTVTDTGSGIPPEIIPNIFDPFFTTKEVGKGTGLGLSTVIGIVKSHGGIITVESVPQRGTVFKVFLPVTEAASEIEPEVPATGSLLGNHELLLVVDDEVHILAATRRVLEMNRYRVLTASSGEEAIRLFVQNGDAVQLVLSDMMMSGMGGAKLVSALRVLQPDIKVIASSGLDDAGKQAEFVSVGIEDFLAKPYTTDLLLQTLSRILAQKRKYSSRGKA